MNDILLVIGFICYLILFVVLDVIRIKHIRKKHNEAVAQRQAIEEYLSEMEKYDEPL